MDETRQTVREIYQFRCGYCSVHEEDAVEIPHAKKRVEIEGR